MRKMIRNLPTARASFRVVRHGPSPSTVVAPAQLLPRRSFSSPSRMFSSVAAEIPEEELTIEDEDNVSRPRLQELRRRLRDEDGANFVHRRPPPHQPAVHVAHTKGSVEFAPLPTPELVSDDVLTDRFGRRHTYLRLSVAERCNLRCTYCMPASGVPLSPDQHLLSTTELLQLAAYFVTKGVTKLRLTGGEPTLRPDLVQVVHGLSALLPSNGSLGMTTNGITTGSLLPALADAGLGSLNVSLDTLDQDTWQQLTRRPAGYLRKVLETMQTAVELLGTTTSALSSIKLNCVVIRGVNDHELADFVRLQQQFPDTQVRFIEYMPFQDNGWKLDKCVTYQEMLQRLERQGIHLQPVPATDPHDTTKWYTTAESGMVGFITSMSDHFCGGCNRLRLAADGSLQVCLFGSGKRTSLREVVRAGGSYAELDVLVRSALAGKEASLGGHAHPEQLVHDTSRPMTLIGG